jgi:hypothetical protein
MSWPRYIDGKNELFDVGDAGDLFGVRLERFGRVVCAFGREEIHHYAGLVATDPKFVEDARRDEISITFGHVPFLVTDLEDPFSLQKDSELRMRMIVPSEVGARFYLVLDHHPCRGMGRDASLDSWHHFTPGFILVMPHRWGRIGVHDLAVASAAFMIIGNELDVGLIRKA